MRRFLPGRLVCVYATALFALLIGSNSTADTGRLPFFQVETFPVPQAGAMTPTVLANLSAETGIAGTEIVGLRVKVGLAEGHRLETLELAIADGRFLVHDRGFLESAGQFLLRVLRFLLLGQLVTAGSGLEIPAQSWSVLFGGNAVDGSEMLDLYTKRDLTLKGNDSAITNHGEFIVCRFLVAANQLSELVNVQIRTKDPRTRDWLSYHIPRVVLPLRGYGFDAAPQIGSAERLGGAEYVGNSAAFGGDEPLILAGYLRSIEGVWGREAE